MCHSCKKTRLPFNFTWKRNTPSFICKIHPLLHHVIILPHFLVPKKCYSHNEFLKPYNRNKPKK